MADKSPINARLDANIVRTLKTQAEANGRTLTEQLEAILTEHQQAVGPTTAEIKIAALEATIAEQEHIVKKHTGKPTPKTRRVSMSLPIAAAQKLERLARDHNVSKSQLVAAAVERAPDDRRLTITEQAESMPALA